MRGAELTDDARGRGQARGVMARQLRAAVRRELAAGTVSIGEVLADGRADDERGRVLARMRVVDLLCSFPGIGPVRAAEMMDRIGIADNRRIGGLGPRQVQQLTDLIEERFRERFED